METQTAELNALFHDPETGILVKLDAIATFVTGANTVFGLARKHWKRIFVFGAGFVTAAGIGNPTVQKIASYITATLGAG